MSITSTVNSVSSVFMVGKAVWNVFKVVTRSAAYAPISKDEAYRPGTWGRYGDESQMLYLAPNITEKKKKTESEGSSEEEVTIGYFFDAFLRENHTGTVKVTDHPVQGGMNISDHAYNLPDTLTIEVFASDSMDSLKTNQFKTLSTKSKSVYETLRGLKERRVLLGVRTRLRRYENMIIENMTVSDDYKTSNALRCTISFKQIIMASVAEKYVLVQKSQVVNNNNKGSQQPEAPKASDLNRMTR